MPGDEILVIQTCVIERLERLTDLADGWYDGSGRALDPAGLSWLGSTLSQAIDAGLPRPYLYPGLEGEVVAEWPFPAAEVSVDFDLDRRSGHLIGTHLRTGAVRQAHLDFSKPSAPDHLITLVSGFGPSPVEFSEQQR